MQDTSADFKGQNSSFENSAGFQQVSTSTVKYFTKTLADQVMKSLCSTSTISCKKDDPLTLLVKPEQMDFQRIHAISGMDSKSFGASPSHLGRIASAVVRETLENFTISSQESLSHCSSSNPLNETLTLNPDPVVVKKRSFGIRFIFRKKAPVIRFGLKVGKNFYIIMI